jgi:hypothetical protein
MRGDGGLGAGDARQGDTEGKTSKGEWFHPGMLDKFSGHVKVTSRLMSPAA